MDRREQRFKTRTAVTKEQALNFLYANEAAEQNREAHQCGERSSNGITQPRGAETPRSSDAHERIALYYKAVTRKALRSEEGEEWQRASYPLEQRSDCRF